MLTDYHTHTPLCHHAEGTPQEFVDQAISCNLSEYGISDHAPQSPEPFDDWRMTISDIPKYLEWIQEAKAYANNKIIVRSGLECDWLPGNESWIDQLSLLHHWDYLIGSIHYLENKWDFDNPKWIGRWNSSSPSEIDQIWTQYWDEYSRMAHSQLFDLLGHPDLIKKFSQRPTGDLRRFYEPTIQAIADSGSAIELNTAGLHKPCCEQYPSEQFLKLAAEANIPITITSDAHHPKEVARDFKEALDLIQGSNFKQLVKFEKRTKSFSAITRL